MCGIAGIISEDHSTDTREAAVDRLCALMAHRGPDDTGRLSVGPATLGMRRLAIFDPLRGAQPMQTADGRHTIVFNGAIYNFRELRRELEASGEHFRTDCDTEVLLAAWARWGQRTFARLRGMYAFAVWDAHEQVLTLARDPFGIKPLYWRRHDSGIAFASELNALISVEPRPAINATSLHAALAHLSVPAPSTLYQDVFSLRAAQWLTWRGGIIRTGTHWRFPFPSSPAGSTDRIAFQRELRHRLDEAVAAHQTADVPVGAFLSGGLDSAVIVGLMSRHTSGPLRTFSIGFEEPEFSEAAEAEATARHFGTRHQTVRITAGDAAASLDSFLAALDQPSGDAFNTFLAARAARAGGVTVALSGLGGDELFGGYPSFRYIPRLARLLPWWRRTPAPLRKLVQRGLRNGSARQRKLAEMLARARSPHEIAILHRSVVDDAQRRELLLTTNDAATLHPELERLPAELAGADLRQVVSAWELRTYMTDVLLRDSDVMSMAHSLELRVPFVDVPLIEWLWSQPSELVITPRAPKSSLKMATADILPPGLLERPKRGFALPFPHWMRSSLRPFIEDTFSRSYVERSGYFNPGAVQAMWRRYLDGHDTRDWSRVWMTAILIAFVNRSTVA